MGLMIDIYRYQTVTDPAAVKRAGVVGAYVKATDGGRKAIVPADNQVRQMKSVGIPVGLYHYAQLSPAPEVQADVLCTEVARLGAVGLPPALDLEDPHKPGGVARDFAARFCRRVRANGFPQVTLYGNTTMLGGIDVETLDVGGLMIWEANHGPNDGRRHDLPRKPWTRNIHQYTSVGTVPGISGKVDLNELLTTIPGGGDDPVDMEDVRKFWEDYRIQVLNPDGSPVIGADGKPYKVSPQEMLAQNNRVGWLGADDESKFLAAVQDLKATIAQGNAAQTATLLGELAKLATGGADPVAIASTMAEILGPNLGRQVLDEMHNRLSE